MTQRSAGVSVVFYLCLIGVSAVVVATNWIELTAQFPFQFKHRLALYSVAAWSTVIGACVVATIPHLIRALSRDDDDH